MYNVSLTRVKRVASGKSTKINERPSTLIIQSGQLRRRGSYPNVVGSVCRLRLTSSVNVRKFAPFLTLAHASSGLATTTRKQKCFFYKSHCGLYVLKFNKGVFSFSSPQHCPQSNPNKLLAHKKKICPTRRKESY